ncbi:MAG: hypothetical protein KGY66_01780 [Candidatus Thermoplasmatota archaeon]|nr:hypothetical protein [Candidatus Thermoplasmatota archaeon]MBS3789626.1 hypothetical protein [Candidatus Thermoplasmatota archaeon]
MSNKADKERGILIRILSSKDIQKGVAFFSIALILAFTAVIPVTEKEIVREEEIKEAPHIKEIPYPSYRVINATLEVSTTGKVNVSLQNSLLGNDTRVWGPETVGSGNETGNETFDLTEIDLEGVPRWLNFTDIQGNLNYTYTVEYSHNPYGLLSLPAGLFTLIGVVYAFRGKGVILGEIKRKQMEDEARKKEKEREEKAEEEKSSEEEEIEGEVIFEGEDTHEEKDEADHIDFMGVPDEDEEDQKR